METTFIRDAKREENCTICSEGGVVTPASFVVLVSLSTDSTWAGGEIFVCEDHYNEDDTEGGE